MERFHHQRGLLVSAATAALQPGLFLPSLVAFGCLSSSLLSTLPHLVGVEAGDGSVERLIVVADGVDGRVERVAQGVESRAGGARHGADLGADGHQVQAQVPQLVLR